MIILFFEKKLISLLIDWLGSDNIFNNKDTYENAISSLSFCRPIPGNDNIVLNIDCSNQLRRKTIGTAASAANNLFKSVRSYLIIYVIFRQLLSISRRSKSTMFNTPSNKRETHFRTRVFIFMISWLKLTKMYFVSCLLDFDTGNMISFDIKYFFLRYRDLKHWCIYRK